MSRLAEALVGFLLVVSVAMACRVFQPDPNSPEPPEPKEPAADTTKNECKWWRRCT